MISKVMLRASLSCLLAVGLTFSAPASANASKAVGCFYNGIYLAGKVRVVTSFPDIRIQLVKSFPDIRVKQVKSFPDRCGRWQIVNSFPDFKVQIVNSFPDLRVQFVNSFPGTK